MNQTKFLTFCLAFNLILTGFKCFAYDNKLISSKVSRDIIQKQEQAKGQFITERAESRKSDVKGQRIQQMPLGVTRYVVMEQPYICLKDAEQRRSQELKKNPNEKIVIEKRVDGELKQVKYWDPSLGHLYRIGNHDTLYDNPQDAARTLNGDVEIVMKNKWDRIPDIIKELRIYSVDGDGFPKEFAHISFLVLGAKMNQGIIKEGTESLIEIFSTREEADKFISLQDRVLRKVESPEERAKGNAFLLWPKASTSFSRLPDNFSFPE
jgi:hypothetical protein